MIVQIFDLNYLLYDFIEKQSTSEVKFYHLVTQGSIVSGHTLSYSNTY